VGGEAIEVAEEHEGGDDAGGDASSARPVSGQGTIDELGAYIRRQRESARLSLRKLAKIAGVSNPYLSQIERGLRKPSAEILQAIAKALEISSETLYVKAGILEERDTDVDVEGATVRDDEARIEELRAELARRNTKAARRLREEIDPTFEIDRPHGDPVGDTWDMDIAPAAPTGSAAGPATTLRGRSGLLPDELIDGPPGSTCFVLNRGDAGLLRSLDKLSPEAASAAIDHIRDWVLGTPDGDWVSMAVPSDGSYGIEKGLIYSFPAMCEDGKWKIVKGLEINDFSRERMKLTERELIEERDAVAHLLPKAADGGARRKAASKA
jgi:transcriptional regulator with XRE-family HTH domain